MVVIYNIDVRSCEIEARYVEVAGSTSEAAAKVWETERETTVSEYVLADEVLTLERSVFCRRKFIFVRICCTRKRSYQPLQVLLLLLLARRGVGAATIDVLLFLLSWLQDLSERHVSNQA